MSEREAMEAPAQFRLVPSEEPGETPAVYSNFAQATISPFDLTLHFGWYALPALTEAPTEPVTVPVRQVVKVTIPLNLVRGTIALLESQLEAWERSFAQQVPEDPTRTPAKPEEGR